VLFLVQFLSFLSSTSNWENFDNMFFVFFLHGYLINLFCFIRSQVSKYVCDECGFEGRNVVDLRQHKLTVHQVLYCIFRKFHIMLEHEYWIPDSSKLYFRSFLNKSQPYSLALELYHFLFNIFRQKLLHHQEFVHTLLKSIEYMFLYI